MSCLQAERLDYYDAEHAEAPVGVGSLNSSDGSNLYSKSECEQQCASVERVEETDCKEETNRHDKKHDIVNMDAPIALVEKIDGKMKVNDKAAEILSSCFVPVTVISIVGKYRTGKSYLMNRFFHSNSGFDLGSTIESTTKGIWMWIKPHPLHDNTALILLDFEGMGDVKKGDKDDDMGLFCLAVLLSKVMIYNVMKVIDNDMIHEIDFVSHLTNKIKISEKEEEEGGEEFMMNFPRLCFVIRDFHLELKENDKEITANEYLENALRCKKGKTTKIRDYNRPRECIKNYFPKRGCYTLCHPVEDTDLLKKLDSLSESELKHKFKHQVHVMTQEILKFADPLMIGKCDYQITGRRLLGLTKTYTNSINTGTIACVESAMSRLMKQEFEIACTTACEVYRNTFSSLTHLDEIASDKDMSDKHKQAQMEALNTYENFAFLEHKEDPEKINEILDKLTEINAEYQQINGKKSKQFWQKTIKDCFSVRSEGILRQEYLCPGGNEKYQKETEKAIQIYEKISQKDYMASLVLQKYLEEHDMEKRMIINMDQHLEEKDKEFKKNQQQLELEACKKESEIQLSRQRLEEMNQSCAAMMFLLDQTRKEQDQKEIQQEQNRRELFAEREKMEKEQSEEIQIQMKAKEENCRKQELDYKTEIEKMKQKQEQAQLNFMQDLKKLQLENKELQKQKSEENSLFTNEIEKLKESFQLATNRATEEQKKRKATEEQKTKLIEDFQKQLQKQEEEANAIHQKKEDESKKQWEQLQEHYEEQIQLQNKEINTLSKEETLRKLINIIKLGRPDYSYLQTDYKTVNKYHDQLKIIQPMAHSDKVYILSAAINIGRSVCGFAFSFKSNPDNIQMQKDYKSSFHERNTSYTTISSLLVDLKDNCIAFGWDAEEKYMKAVAAKKQDAYALYRLSDDLNTLPFEKLTQKSTITSTGGRTSDAFKIYSIILRWMKNKLIETLSHITTSLIPESMIKWVITVPAIWSDEAKQEFRSHQEHDNIVITEEEAILSLIQHLDDFKYLIKPRELFTVKPGLQFIIINAGEKTTDFTALRILPTGKFTELHFSSGGPWGSEQVIKEFIQIMIQILGKIWMTKNLNTWSYLANLIHSKIKHVQIAEESQSLCIEIPEGLHYKLLQKSKRKLAINGVSVQNNKVTFTKEVSLALFQPLKENIRKHLNMIQDKVHSIDTVILAGSFSYCAIIQECIKECIPKEASLVVPSDPGLAVIKGAVYYGHELEK